MKRLAMFVAFFVCVGLHLTMAQTVQITGTVTSKEDGQPLPGVAVTVKGTNVGTATDFQGKYSLSVSANAKTLVIKFIGMKSQEVEIAGKSVVNISLEPDAVGLNEVVVTALGVKRDQKALGYSVSKVNSDDIVNARETNIVNALAGKVSGVYVNNSSGLAGSSARILIRGNSSLSYNSQPLFIVDGVPYDNSENKFDKALFYGSTSNTAIDIDANQIDNVTVLKGAAATALYGSRASGGVVMITTKGGNAKEKKPFIEFNSNTAFDVIRPQKRQCSYGQGTNGVYFDGEKKKSSFSWGPLLDTTNIKIYDPFDFFKVGHTLDNSLSISGALGNNSTYYLSYSNYNQEGTEPNNSFERNSFLAKFSSKISDRLTLAAKFNYTRSDNERLPEGNGLSSPMWSILSAPVTYNFLPAIDSLGNQRLYRTLTRNNQYWLKDNTRSVENRDHFNPNFSLDYQILPWMTITSKLGIDYYANKTKFWENKGIKGDYPEGRVLESTVINKEINSDLLLQINRNIAPEIKLNVMVGNNINSQYYNKNTEQGYSFIIPNYFNLSNTSSQDVSESTRQKRTYSFYGQAVVSYRDYLYLTLTGRNDWSSTLPKNNNSYFYPSISTGFVFSELLNSSLKNYLTYGKLRLSYAQVGHDAEPYSTQTSYSKANPEDGQRGNIIYPYNGVGSYLQSNIAGNPNLKPEISSEWETGLEMKFFNNRIGFDVTYYTKRSKDQIFEAPIAAETGYINRIVNAGEITNKGVEAQLNLTPIVFRDFKWDIGLIYTKNNNKVIRLAEGVDNIQLAGFTDPGIFIKAGSPFGVIWGTRYKRNDKNQVLVDDDGYPIQDNDLGPIGNATPKWTGSLSNIFTWKGISLSAMVDIRVGGDIVNLDETYMAYYGTSYLTRDRSHPVVFDGISASTGQKNTVEVDPQDYYQTVSSISEFMVQKTDFIRLRELSIGYVLPKNILKGTLVKGINIMLTGRNLWLKTDKSFTGSDPEQSLYGSASGQGLINFQVPSTKSYNIALKVTF